MIEISLQNYCVGSAHSVNIEVILCLEVSNAARHTTNVTLFYKNQPSNITNPFKTLHKTSTTLIPVWSSFSNSSISKQACLRVATISSMVCGSGRAVVDLEKASTSTWSAEHDPSFSTSEHKYTNANISLWYKIFTPPATNEMRRKILI